MELPHPCISPLELGSGVLLNQCMHACMHVMPVVHPAPFLCNYLITRCDVILMLGHISRWNTVNWKAVKIDLATSWRAPSQVSASARLPVERMSTLFTCHYFQKQLEDSQPQWNESETVTWLWVTPGSHKKISVFKSTTTLTDTPQSPQHHIMPASSSSDHWSCAGKSARFVGMATFVTSRLPRVADSCL